MAPRRSYDVLDARFERLLQHVELDVLETELTPEKREARRRLADADDLEFCRIYFKGIFDSPFNDVHRYIAAAEEGIHPVGAFRRAGKSAFAYVGKAVKRMALGDGGLIAIGLRNQEKAEARTSALVRLMKRNRLLEYDYGVKIEQDKAGWHIVNNTHLVAVSYKTGLRSLQDDDFKRIRLFIGDDLYDRTSVSSALDNLRVVQFVTSEVHGQLEDDGLALIFGNHITPDSPIIQLQERFPATSFNLPALDADGNSTWPERFDKAHWEEFRSKTDWDVWLSEYMLTPAVRGEVFQPEWIRTVNINLVQILASVTALDPQYGQSPHACFKGMATVGATSSDEAVVLDMYLRREPYGDLFEYVDALRGRIPAWKILLFEDDFAQWTHAARDYADWQARTRRVLPIHVHRSKDMGDKDSRILTLEHPHRTAKLKYSMELTPDGQAGSEDFKLFRTQLLAVGGIAKEKLDGPDALATAWIMVFRYIETGHFKPLKKRRMHAPRWLGGFR